MTGAEARAEAQWRLDTLADELVAQGCVEFVDFYMPHRAVIGESPLPASEVYGIRYDEDVDGYRVFHRDTGLKKVLLEAGDWEDARALYVKKVIQDSPFGKRQA